MNVRLLIPIKFTAGVYYNDQLRMNNYSIQMFMLTNSVDGESHNIAVERARVFIQTQLDSSVFINRSNHEQCRKLADAGIKVVTLPEEPVDQIVGMMLYCKLNAIMEERMDLVEIEISSDLGENVIYLHSEAEHLGPFDNDGWWHDADLIYYDTELVETDNVMPLNRAAIWRELGLNWPETEENKQTGNTIVFADFSRDETR